MMWQKILTTTRHLIGRLPLKVFLTIFLLYCLIHFRQCFIIGFYDMLNYERHHFIWIDFKGRLGNQMFQYAFVYAMAKKYEGKIVLPREQLLSGVFGVPLQTPDMVQMPNTLCRCYLSLEDKWDCAYDSSVEEYGTTRKDMYFDGFFQSWKYWIMYEDDIRLIFQFLPHIKNRAQIVLQNVLSKHGVRHGDGTVLVGMHIRSGDYSKVPHFRNYGYKLATKSYFNNAMQYFKNKFKKVLFIACTNDVEWTRKTLSETHEVALITGNSPEVDMALLTKTHHTIMSVGTFGWWIGFLTNGTVVHYKYPYVEGTGFAKQFNGGTGDHFYPGWIGME